MEPLVETWQINQRINQYLLDSLTPELLSTPLAKGKTVLAGFTHMHNVRLMWLKVCAPDLHADQIKFERGEGDMESVRERLASSADAISEVLRRAGSPEGRVKGFKPHAAGFLGYMISHDTFHRAHIELALRQAGTPISDQVMLGLWEWGSR